MNEYNRIFANNMKYYMNRYGYNQTSLGEKLGVSHSTVATWVTGVNFPRITKIEALCKLFNCSKADLLQIEQHDLSSNEKMQMDRLMIYAQKLNEKGITKVIDFIEDLKEDYFD